MRSSFIKSLLLIFAGFVVGAACAGYFLVSMFREEFYRLEIRDRVSTGTTYLADMASFLTIYEKKSLAASQEFAGSCIDGKVLQFYLCCRKIHDCEALTPITATVRYGPTLSMFKDIAAEYKNKRADTLNPDVRREMDAAYDFLLNFEKSIHE